MATEPRHPALRLFVFLLAVYGATASGHFYISDSRVKLMVAESLVDRGTVALPTSEVQHVMGADHRPYSPWAPGTSLVMVGCVLAGRGLDGAAGLGPVSAHYLVTLLSDLTNAVFTAATAAILVLFARHLGYATATALSLGLLFGLATPAWPLSKTSLSEVPAACAVSLAFYLGARWASGALPVGWIVGAGLALGVGGLFVYPTLMLVPWLLGWVVLEATRAGRPGGQTARGVAGCLAALVLAQVPSLVYNHVRFGSWLSTGYSFGMDVHLARRAGLATAAVLACVLVVIAVSRRRIGASTAVREWAVALGVLLALMVVQFDVFEGFFRHLLSPCDGQLFYCPPLALVALGAWPFVRRWPLAGGVVASAVATYLYVASSGLTSTWSWGSRYVVPVLPLGLLLALPVLEPRWGGTLRRAACRAIVAFGFLVQVLGVSGSYHVYKDEAMQRSIARMKPGPSWAGHELRFVYDAELFSVKKQWEKVRTMETWTFPVGPVTDRVEIDRLRGRFPDFWWCYAALSGVPPGPIRSLMAVALAVVAVCGLVLARAVRGAPAEADR
ncbi:MAG: hypothetical protein HY815_17935 [Candidatus Riflebacteria bacterium]|nr:hypothetical protein [Candidatus Riflebacteria bacterium]